MLSIMLEFLQSIMNTFFKTEIFTLDLERLPQLG